MKKMAVALVVLGIGLIGCKKKSTETTAYSCDFPTAGICLDYGAGFTAATAETACSTSKGTYAASACSAENRVGSCVLSEHGVTQTTRYYSTVFTTALAQDGCAASGDSGAGGTFTAD